MNDLTYATDEMISPDDHTNASAAPEKKIPVQIQLTPEAYDELRRWASHEGRTPETQGEQIIIERLGLYHPYKPDTPSTHGTSASIHPKRTGQKRR